MKRISQLLLLGGILGLLVSCGGSDENVSDLSEDEVVQICQDYMEVYCQKANECYPEWVGFLGLDDCSAFVEDSCAPEEGEGEAGEEEAVPPECEAVTESDVDACLSTIESTSCDELEAYFEEASADIPGCEKVQACDEASKSGGEEEDTLDAGVRTDAGGYVDGGGYIDGGSEDDSGEEISDAGTTDTGSTTDAGSADYTTICDEAADCSDLMQCQVGGCVCCDLDSKNICINTYVAAGICPNGTPTGNVGSACITEDDCNASLNCCLQAVGYSLCLLTCN